MREILFRGKTTRDSWVNGDILHGGYDYHTAIREAITKSVIAVYPETVGQFTGLTDKNGKKIFEGDIVRDKTNGVIYQISYSNDSAMFIKKSVLRSSLGNPLHLEVIGNIHDNPEPLKGD